MATSKRCANTPWVRLISCKRGVYLLIDQSQPRNRDSNVPARLFRGQEVGVQNIYSRDLCGISPPTIWFEVSTGRNLFSSSCESAQSAIPGSRTNSLPNSIPKEGAGRHLHHLNLLDFQSVHFRPSVVYYSRKDPVQCPRCLARCPSPSRQWTMVCTLCVCKGLYGLWSEEYSAYFEPLLLVCDAPGQRGLPRASAAGSRLMNKDRISACEDRSRRSVRTPVGICLCRPSSNG